MPPWFSGSLEEDIQKQRNLETEDRQRAREFNKQFEFQGRGERTLRKQQTNEVIDLEAAEDQNQVRNGEVIDLDSNGDDESTVGGGGFVCDPKIRMGDFADKARAEPPIGEQESHVIASSPKTDPDEVARADVMDEGHDETVYDAIARQPTPLGEITNSDDAKEDDEMLDWSESDNESPKTLNEQATTQDEATSKARQSRSPSMEFEFEDVGIPEKPIPPQEDDAMQDTEDAADLAGAWGSGRQDAMVEGDIDEEDFDDFSDPEDEQLLLQLAKEAEEHARFASTLNNKSQAQNIADYEKELKQLRNQQKKDRRDADEVTHIMITECQQLLRLFGLPYVTAPMEAEAQCAELVRLGLVDGIVTDDSDCFLFGGNRVYKNMFNQAKLVECYLSSDLEKAGWPRDKLVQTAHLLGSDYTEGLPGIGPVGAAEILGEFQTLDEFKEWWNGVQMNTIPKSEDSGNPIRKKLRKQSTKLFLPPSFPDTRVDIAYTSPDVDHDAEPFQWGVPDLDALRSFLMATIGWSQERTDEVLVPVIRDMNRRMDEGTQSNITAFFDGGVGIGAAVAANGNTRSEAFAPRKRAAESSKRMGSALSRMAEKAKLHRGNIGNNTSVDESKEKTVVGLSKKRTTKGSKRKTAVSSEDDETSEFEGPRKKTKKGATATKPPRSRKQKTQAES